MTTEPRTGTERGGVPDMQGHHIRSRASTKPLSMQPLPRHRPRAERAREGGAVNRARVCSFQAGPDVKRRTRYETVKREILAAGRFSVFEATATTYAAAIFDRLCRDPEIEIVPMPFPWTGVREKPGEPAPEPKEKP
jgi:hypothetical protein